MCSLEDEWDALHVYRLSISQVTHNTTEYFGLISKERFGHLFIRIHLKLKLLSGVSLPVRCLYPNWGIQCHVSKL
jgi:hypothetical protein